MAQEYIAETAVAVRADTSHVKGDVEKGVKEAVDSTEVKKAAGGLGSLSDALRNLNGEVKPGAAAVNVLDDALSGTAGTVALVGGALAVGVGVLALSANAYENLAEKVQKFSEESGTTAETASRFVAVFGDYGVSVDTAANSLAFLGRAVETDEKRLTDLGLNVKRTATGQLDLAATTISLADAYAKTTDPGKRAELVMAALGRQGRDLIPVLEKGGDGLRKMLAGVGSGQILSESDIAQAENFKIAINQVHDSFQEIEISLARGIVPALAAAARDSEPLFGALGAGINNVTIGLRAFTEAARNPSELGNWDKFTEKVLAAATGVASLVAQEQQAAATQDLIAKSELSLVDVALRDEAAHNQLADATKRVWEAQADYNDALAGTGKYAQAATDAARNLTSAENSLADAQRRVRDLTVDIGDAQDAAAEAAFRYGAGSKEAHDAAEAVIRKQEDLRSAQAAVGDQTNKVADAQKKVADTRDLSDERAAAADRLKTAQFNLEQQTVGVATADTNLQVVQDGLRGKVDETTDRVQLQRSALEKLMGPLPQDAKNDLQALFDSIPPAVSSATPAGSLSAGQLKDFINVPQGHDPAAAAGILAGEPHSNTQETGGAAGIQRIVTGQPSVPVNVTINYPVDWQQMIEQAEYASGVR